MTKKWHKDVPVEYRKVGYEVYKNGVYEGFSTMSKVARAHAKKIKGVVKHSKNRRKILFDGR